MQQTYKLTLDETIADKILWLLNSLKENIQIEKLPNLPISKTDMELSISDLKSNKIIEIDNIDKHIEELKNAIK